MHYSSRTAPVASFESGPLAVEVRDKIPENQKQRNKCLRTKDEGFCVKWKFAVKIACDVPSAKLCLRSLSIFLLKKLLVKNCPCGSGCSAERGSIENEIRSALVSNVFFLDFIAKSFQKRQSIRSADISLESV